MIAESFERIHRSNLVGMGIIPLQFEGGKTVESLGLTGEETYEIVGFKERLASKFEIGRTVAVVAHGGGWEEDDVRGEDPHRHAAGDSVLRARRDFAVRVAAVGGEVNLDFTRRWVGTPARSKNASGHLLPWSVMQANEILCAQWGGRVSAAVIVAELDLDCVWREVLHDGPNLSARQSELGYIPQESDFGKQIELHFGLRAKGHNT